MPSSEPLVVGCAEFGVRVDIAAGLNDFCWLEGGTGRANSYDGISFIAQKAGGVSQLPPLLRKLLFET